MGFGLLFLGYLLLLPAPLIYVYYTVPFAALLLGWASFKLRRVNLPFGHAFYPACISGLLGIMAVLCDTVPALEGGARYVKAACMVTFAIWHLFMLQGLAWVAEETSLKELQIKATRNRVLSCIYFFPAALLLCLYELPKGDILQPLFLGTEVAFCLFGLCVMIMNLMSFYTAYMRICMPGDEDMHRRPSRFAFINRYRERVRMQEEEALRLQEEMRKNRMQRKKKKGK